MDTFITPQLARRLFVASVFLVIISLVASLINVAAVMSAPLRTTTTVPSTIGFEGFLSAVSDGTHSLTFRIYSASTGGSALWTESQSGVQVTNGLFSVVLGGVTAFGSDTFNGNRWIGVTVDGGTELSPRTQVASVPFALQAENSNKIGGGALTNLVALFEGACPTGWTEYTAAQGRVVVGVPTNGTLAGTVGTALTDREDRTHTHTVDIWGSNRTGQILTSPSESRTYIIAGGGSVTWVSTATSTNVEAGKRETSASASTSSVIPYIQLRYCKLNP